MAGFDFDFSHSPEHQAYVQACIQAAKRRAHSVDCRWRVSRLAEVRTFRCIIDGQTRNLDLLGRALEHDLPIICEGVRGGLRPSQASRLGLGFAELYLIGRDINRGEGCQTLRPVKETSLYYPIFDFVGRGKVSPLLSARLRITEDVVTDFGLGRYESVVIIEEMHTALEQTFRELLPTLPNGANWPTLIKAAHAAGYLSSDSRVPAHSHPDVEVLEELTKRRNRAKHRRGDPEDPWILEHWSCVAAILEGIVKRL
jgi:hypothetical protein